MELFETRFKQVDVLPMVKHYMDELDLFNIFTKYIPASTGSLAVHAESLCILTANIICIGALGSGQVNQLYFIGLRSKDRRFQYLFRLFWLRNDRYTEFESLGADMIPRLSCSFID